jgi:hypothetical protein
MTTTRAARKTKAPMMMPATPPGGILRELARLAAAAGGEVEVAGEGNDVVVVVGGATNVGGAWTRVDVVVKELDAEGWVVVAMDVGLTTLVTVKVIGPVRGRPGAMGGGALPLVSSTRT